MVCQDCERKLSKVIVPDKWKDGARNTTGGEDGGRATSYRNSLLQVRGKEQRFQAGVRACRICRSKVAQDAHYCQECAFHKGICAMCGKRVDDLRFDRRGLLPAEKRKLPQVVSAVSAGGDYGTSERFKQAKTTERTERTEAAAVLEDRQAVETGKALEVAEKALARAAGRTLVDDRPAPMPAAAQGCDGWATAKDVASGRVYYFNANTKETSWVWPPASVVKRQGGAFIPAATFGGKSEGYVFTTRGGGTGYYRDAPVQTQPTDGQQVSAFIPAAAFGGRRVGYVFTTGDRGTGYYGDGGASSVT